MDEIIKQLNNKLEWAKNPEKAVILLIQEVSNLKKRVEALEQNK
jgi:hypothetical protein